jgi:hypothetical protein
MSWKKVITYGTSMPLLNANKKLKWIIIEEHDNAEQRRRIRGGPIRPGGYAYPMTPDTKHLTLGTHK